MTVIDIIGLAFFVPCLAVIGALFGLHLATLMFGQIRINKTHTINKVEQ